MDNYKYRIMQRTSDNGRQDVSCVCKCANIVRAVDIVDALKMLNDKKYPSLRKYGMLGFRLECSGAAHDEAVRYYKEYNPGFCIEEYFDWQ